MSMMGQQLPMIARKKPQRIGEVMKTARKRLGLTAEQVGACCNVSRSRIYMWEASDYVFPKNLPQLSLTLGIPEERLRKINGEPS